MEKSITMSFKEDKNLSDFNRYGDDRKAYDRATMAKMDTYTRFEKEFPFYRMDVNGYGYLIKRAQEIECELKRSREEVKTVKLKSLQAAFSQHQSWSEMNTLESKFVRFLKAACSDESDPETFRVLKLRCIGILWCEDEPKEKVIEFFDMLQEGKEKITCNDRELKDGLTFLFDLATNIVYE